MKELNYNIKKSEIMTHANMKVNVRVLLVSLIREMNRS